MNTIPLTTVIYRVFNIHTNETLDNAIYSSVNHLTREALLAHYWSKPTNDDHRSVRYPIIYSETVKLSIKDIDVQVLGTFEEGTPREIVDRAGKTAAHVFGTKPFRLCAYRAASIKARAAKRGPKAA
jgi:hypothetical protein